MTPTCRSLGGHGFLSRAFLMSMTLSLSLRAFLVLIAFEMRLMCRFCYQSKKLTLA